MFAATRGSVFALAKGQQLFTASGTFTVPAGVTSISAVAVGRGGATPSGSTYGGGGGALSYSNAVAVTPGESLDVVIDTASSRVLRGATELLKAVVGAAGDTTGAGGAAASGVGDVRRSGGQGAGAFDGRGGGGAAGYSGDGGAGGIGYNPGASGAGGGGGGGGGGASSFASGGGGGGVGVLGEGASGAGGIAGGYRGDGGSGGTGGTVTPTGGAYGGGAGTLYFGSGTGGGGAVRIIWGLGRSFPNNAADV